MHTISTFLKYTLNIVKEKSGIKVGKTFKVTIAIIKNSLETKEEP